MAGSAGWLELFGEAGDDAVPGPENHLPDLCYLSIT